MKTHHRCSLFLLLFLVPFAVLANESGGDSGGLLDFSWLGNLLQSIADYFYSFVEWVKDLFHELRLLFVNLPDFIERAFAYLIEWAVMLKVKFMLHSIEFAHSVAVHIIQSVNLDGLISSAMAKLPPDLRATFGALGIFKAITMMLEAVVTRFVLNIIGW